MSASLALPLSGSADFSAEEADAILQPIRARGDRIVTRFLLIHAGLALVLSFAYQTWLVSGVVTSAALGMFLVSLWLLPGSTMTRVVAGISLQAFVALHIYQMHGLAEMHFFFFTGTTVLIVYQDAKCFWPGAFAIIVQHLTFALLHNSGVDVYFFEQSFVGLLKLVFHFGIVLGQVGICSFWALLLRRQTLRSAAGNRQLQVANVQLRQEVIERQQAEEALVEAEAHFARVAANVPGMVYQFVLRPDGTSAFPYVSEWCRVIFGVDPQEVAHDASPIFARIHPDEIESLQQSIALSAATLSPWQWEGRLLVEGETKWMRGSARPAAQPDGSILWDGVVVDATQAKLAETALRAAKEEAERANLAKSEFLSRMSHELRTPLNAILGFGQLLGRKDLPPDQRESVQHIVKGGKHLLSLINEVLEISRIESGRIDLSIEPVEIDPLVHDVVTMMKPLATERDIGLRVIVPRDKTARGLCVLADLQRLRQALLNLVSNAIKYNFDWGTVTISWELLASAPAHAVDSAGCWVRLSVRDSGRGIPDDKLNRLFSPFDRLGAENEAIEGSGIGLALTKRLIEAMNGFVGVESVSGKGSVFHLDLPMAECAASARGSLASIEPVSLAAQPDAETPRQTVLQIEDNRANRELISHALELRGGIRLLSATDGERGLQMAREHRPDLILLDLNLPGIHGAEVLQQLSEDPRLAQIPVVVLSADATQHQMRRLLSQGAYAYLTKPVDLDRLFELMDETLLPSPEQLVSRQGDES